MSNSNNNPFTDAFKHFGDWKNLNQFKQWSNLDMNQMNHVHERNVKALTALNQAATESMQAIMRRQAEVMQANAAEAFQMVKECSVSGNQEAAMSKQLSYVKSMVESAVANSREMMDLAVKSGMEVFDLVSENVTENVGEVLSCASKRKSA